MRKYLLLAAILIAAAGGVLADTIEVGAMVEPSRVAPGSPAVLTVTVIGTQRAEPPEVVVPEGLRGEYIGPRTLVEIVNGRTSSSIRFLYRLTPMKAGTFTVGPFTVRVGNSEYTAAAVTLTAAGQGEGGGPDEADELAGAVSFSMEVKKDRAYVGEEIPVTVRLKSRVSLTDISYPILTATGFTVRRFAPHREERELIEGSLYEVIEFDTAVYAGTAGELVLGPARSTCTMVVRRRIPRSLQGRGGLNDSLLRDAFAMPERRPLELASGSVTVSVRALPYKGRPADFDGAVGSYELEVDAVPLEVKAGEPLTVTMTVRGDGNIASVTLPQMASEVGFKAYEPQVRTNTVEWERGAPGERTFEQVLIPEDESVVALPRLSFSYFDPAEGEYRTVRGGAIPITVLPDEQDGGIRIVDVLVPAREPAEESLGRDIVYIKGSPGGFRRAGARLYGNPAFLVSHAAAALVFLAVVTVGRRRRRLEEDVAYARLARAPRKAQSGLAHASKLLQQGQARDFYETVYQTVQELVGDLHNLAPGSVTRDGVCALVAGGLEENLARDLEALFDACDRVRFTPGEAESEEVEETMLLAHRVISALSRSPGG